MKLNTLALAVSLATSITLVGCGGDDQHSKKGDKASEQTVTTATNAALKALSININGTEITGLTQEIVTFDHQGKILIDIKAQREAALLKKSKRLASAFQVVVIENPGLQVDGTIESGTPTKPRIATSSDLTAQVLVSADDEVQIELTIHNPKVQRIQLVRAEKDVNYVVTEFHRAGFNIAPANNPTVVAAKKAGIVKDDGTINAALSNVFTRDDAKLDKDGKIKVTDLIGKTTELAALKAIQLSDLTKAGIKVTAIIIEAGKEAEQQVLTSKDASATLDTLIFTVGGSENTALYALVFSFDSGLKTTVDQTLVALVKSGETAKHAVDFLINTAIYDQKLTEAKAAAEQDKATNNNEVTALEAGKKLATTGK